MALLLKDLDNDNDVIVETTEFFPSHFMVIVESFSLLSENGIDKYESTEFEAGGFKWRLIIYPNGKEHGTNGDNVSVYLSVADPSSLIMSLEINAIFGIFLRNHISDNFLCVRGKARRRFHALSPACGFSKFISKKILTDPSNGYLVDDMCVFGAELFVFKKPNIIERLSLMKVAKPYVRSWTIPNYSEIKDKWISESFTVADKSWCVYLTPDGLGDDEGRSISIFLRLVNNPSCQKVKANYIFRIKDQTDDNHWVRTGVRDGAWFEKYGWGFRKFIPIADMNDPEKGPLHAIIKNYFHKTTWKIIVGKPKFQATTCLRHLLLKLSWSNQASPPENFATKYLRPKDHCCSQSRCLNTSMISHLFSVPRIVLERVDERVSEFRPPNTTIRAYGLSGGTGGVWFEKLGWRFLKFMSIADMKDPTKCFVVKDRCILEVEISVLAVART